ncbi:hypothetical protein EJ08DRAFT_693914 [Tothia fuscella]|uniref:Uncharacterized protein n=1 Tax=Tothia fuscella TaxID=1048955 RepID=A0A9P4NY37_9PEZI|nr:hypothetical protein EJ08DRAFT_693914 [Tothia fuscella]
MVPPTLREVDSSKDKFGNSKKIHYAMLPSLALGIAFCVPHGVHTGHLAPALGLIPMALGAVLALYRSGLFRRVKKGSSAEYQILLTNEAVEDPAKKFNIERFLLFVADWILMGGLIGTMVAAFLTNGVHCYYYFVGPGWSNSRYTCHDDGLSMLAAYGTMPLLFNAVIHAYLILQFIYYAAPKMFGDKKEAREPVCSRCSIPIREGGKHPQERSDEPVPDMEPMGA